MAEAPAVPFLSAEQARRLAIYRDRYYAVGRIQDLVYALHGWRIDDQQAKRLLLLRHLAETGRVSEWVR